MPGVGRRWRVLALVVLALSGALVYANTLSNPFVFDDVLSIESSPNVRHLWPPRTALGAPPGSGASGRPLVALTLAVNFAFGGLQPGGYHALNIGLHILAAWILFLLLRATLQRPPLQARFGPSADPLALAVSLLWLVHPLHTAALNHIIYRSEILAGLCGLLTLEGLRQGATRERGRWWLAGSVAAGALAMTSKEIAVVFPVLAWVYDSLFLAGSYRQALRRRAAFYAGLASTWLLLAFLVAGADRGASVGLHLETVSPLAYARTQLGVVVHYLRLVFWPHPLVIDYDWPIAPTLGAVWWQALLLLLLAGATGALLFRRHPAAYPGAWFFLLLLPSSSFIPITGAVAAEHRMYLPALAPILLVVLGGFRSLQRRLPDRGARRIGAVSVLIAAAALAGVTWQRNQDFASEIRLWSQTARARPENPRAHNNLGSALVEAGEIEAAIPHFDAAVRAAPEDAPARRNLGGALLRRGQVDAALQQIQTSLRLDPRDAVAHVKLGQALQLRGERDGAIAAYEDALRLNPTLVMAHQNAGIALLELRRYGAAAQHFAAGLELDPDHVGTLVKLAWLRATCPDSTWRDGAQAVRCAERAARLTQRRDPEALDALAAAYAEIGRFDAALGVLRELHGLVAGDPRAPLARLEQCRQLYAAHRPYRMDM